MNKTALVVGATGLVGGTLLEYLLNEIYYRKVIVLTRSRLPIQNPKLEEIIVDFDHLQNTQLSREVDDVYCCLGTTMKKAGSKEAFRRVDYHYPLETARLGLKNGASQYLIVTALGANKKSVFFYNRVKGEVEEALWKLNFEAIHIFRPSLLLGEREEQRTGEKMSEIVMKFIQPFLIAGLKKFRAIKSEKVAAAMYKIAQENLKGRFIYESDKIMKITNGRMKLPA